MKNNPYYPIVTLDYQRYAFVSKGKRPVVTRKQTRKKRIPRVVVVTHTSGPADQTLFPEKLEKAKEILSRTTFMSK